VRMEWIAERSMTKAMMRISLPHRAQRRIGSDPAVIAVAPDARGPKDSQRPDDSTSQAAQSAPFGASSTTPAHLFTMTGSGDVRLSARRAVSRPPDRRSRTAAISP
jgi:hypothetical protein